jgi:hypothetical protein
MSDIDDLGYSYEEHEMLMDAAAKVLLATVAADRSGPVAYFAEMTAAGTFLYDARKRYRDNPLVQELYRRQESGDLTSVPAAADASVDVSRETLLRDIGRIGEVLRRDDAGMGFRRFLMELAERVAKASRGVWFGSRISAGEAAYLADLRSRLGLPQE